MVRESAPRITPAENVMAMLGGRGGLGGCWLSGGGGGWWRRRRAYIEVPRLDGGS